MREELGVGEGAGGGSSVCRQEKIQCMHDVVQQGQHGVCTRERGGRGSCTPDQ